MKLLWMYWNEDQTPLLEKIKDHNTKVLTSWKIMYVTDKNIHEYIPSFPPKYKTLIHQHKADWIRLYLIMTYGGVWCDASIIINDESKVNELWEKTKTYDFVGFHTTNKKIKGQYVCVENFLFASKKGGKLITLWYDEFTKAIEEGFVPYRRRIVSEGTNIDHYYPNGLTKKVYFTAYLCLQHIIQHNDVSMYLTPSTTLLFFQNACIKKYKKFNPYCVKKMLQTKKVKLLYIKLTRTIRATNPDLSLYV